MTASDIFQDVSKTLLKLEERPQFGVPEFPWKELEKALCHRFQQSQFTLTHQEKGWISFENFSQPLKDTKPVVVYVSHIETPIFWFMSREDVEMLIPTFFGGNKTAAYFLETPLYEGVVHFFSLEVLSEIDHLRFGDQLSFQIGELPNDFEKILHNERHFEIDITASLAHSVLHGTLLIPASFRSAWKKSFAQFSQIRSKEWDTKIEVDIALEIGHVQLSIEEVKKIQLGDFVRLDHCSYNPEEKEGWVALSFEGKNIFRGRLKKEGIKLLEFPHLEKGKKAMDENEAEEIIEPTEVKETIAVEQLPLHLVIEIARLKMTLEEVAKLSPGSILELPVSVEEGVDLVINGKKIGKGELLKIGDVVGIRITKL